MFSNPDEKGALFAGTPAGVFSSTDGGQRWQPANSGLPEAQVQALAINPNDNTLYAGIAQAGVFRSTDRGQSWQEINTGLDTNLSVQVLLVDPQNNIPYVATTGGVFRYLGFLAPKWRPVGEKLNDISVQALALDSQTGVLYAGVQVDVVRFEPSVGEWQTVSQPEIKANVSVLMFNPLKGELYAGTDSAGAFLSPNGGQNWEPANQGLPPQVSALALDSQNELLYVGTDFGVFYSADSGQNWQPANQGLPQAPISALVRDPLNKILYAGTDFAGVFLSKDDGQSWQPAGNELANLPVPSLALEGQDVSFLDPDAPPQFPPEIVRPAGFYWHERFPVDRSRLDISHAALEALYKDHPDELEGKPYPWRLSYFPATGLPVFLRLWRSDPLGLWDNKVSPRISQLLNDLQIQAIFGLQDPTEIDLELEPGPVIKFGNPEKKGDTPLIYHFTWKQVYQNEYPIIGGSVRLHGKVGDKRMAVTSSYFPIPVDYKFPDILPSINDNAALNIIPFDRAYRRVRRIQIKTTSDIPWYVDVDGSGDEVLGGSWQRALHANYYETSRAAMYADIPSDEFATAPAGPVGQVASLLASSPDMPNVKVELEDFVSNLDAMLKHLTDNIASTVAANALLLYYHLRKKCEIQLLSSQKIKIDLASTDKTNFYYPDLNDPTGLTDPTIRFQADTGSGIPEGSQMVYRPARDPELVMHEFTHAFLWLLDSESWDTPETLGPFGRALQEGYAMYLSRSLAAQRPGEENRIWARAAYSAYKRKPGGVSGPPTQLSPKNWEDRWGFGRAKQVVGADLLPAPNVYPAGDYSTENISVYDTGMVWARALWDLRDLLGGDQVDLLAVQAYPYLHGYIANFELAAEAMLDVDIKQADKVNLTNGSQPIWEVRGIAAGQGIHGFAQATNNTLIAASDAGILISTNFGGDWTTDATLTGVVGVTAHDNIFFAAVQQPMTTGNLTQWDPGIFWKDANSMALPWQPLGNWPDEVTPLNLLAFQENPTVLMIIVGTSQGVYYSRITGPVTSTSTQGAQWLSIGNLNSTFTALDLTTRSDASVRLRVCTPTDIRQIRLDRLMNDWTLSNETIQFGGTIGQPIQVRPTLIGEGNNVTYVGTMDHGLWEMESVFTSTTQVSLPPPTSPNHGAILALAARSTDLFVATDENIFFSNNGGPFTARQLPTTGAKVISLYVTSNNNLLAGTLAHGVWRHDGSNWQSSTGAIQAASTLLTIQPEERVLLSFVQQTDGSRMITKPTSVILKVAQPGFSLLLIQPTINTYSLHAGPVILMLENPSNTTAVHLTIPQIGGTGNIAITQTLA